MLVFTEEQMRKEEERGFLSGISYEQMMRTAGENAADLIDGKGLSLRRVCILCGKGKNGGDGFVAACRLAERRHRVSVVLAMGEPKDELARKMYEEAKSRFLSIADYTKDEELCLDWMEKADCLVDAVFGIGFRGELSGSLRVLAEKYNAASAYRIALDIPSGIPADQNELPAQYFHTDMTITMHGLKPALAFAPTEKACGDIQVADIGFSLSEASAYLCEKTEFSRVKGFFHPRSETSHKGSFGRALSICGSYSMPGAPVLAARAAVECGAGLTEAAFPEPAYPAIASKLTEPIFLLCDADENGAFSQRSVERFRFAVEKANAVLFGCGVGTGRGCEAILRFLLRESHGPLILDADGINLLAANKDVLKERSAPTLLTPHPGEMARLTGTAIPVTAWERIRLASDFAKEYGVNLLLKGHRTLIADPNGRVFCNPTGNAGMATGGSGDLLAGMILSFASQGMPLFQAAVAGAYLHGAAGDLAAKRWSMMGTTPTRMLDCIPSLLSKIEEEM